MKRKNNAYYKNETTLPNCSAVLSSCDEYSFLWDGFLKLLDQHFPGITTLYSTASKEYKYANITMVPIKQSKDLSFSSRLIACIENNIHSEYILFMLDDFFLMKDIDEVLLAKSISVLDLDKTVGMICLHDIVPYVKRCKEEYNQDFGIIDKRTAFCINTQISLWRKSFFLKVLRHGESAWEFENYASYRNKFYREKCLFIKDEYRNGFLYYDGGVLARGVVRDNNVLDFLKSNNIDITNYPLTKNVTIYRKRSFLKRCFVFFRRFVYMRLSVIFGKN